MGEKAHVPEGSWALASGAKAYSLLRKGWGTRAAEAAPLQSPALP